MKTVAPNFDKPHRCPLCHRIPYVARKDGFAISNKTYECNYCDVRWITPTHYIHIRNSELDEVRKGLIHMGKRIHFLKANGATACGLHVYADASSNYNNTDCKRCLHTKAIMADVLNPKHIRLDGSF